MSLIHVWKRDLQTRLAVIPAEIERRAIRLQPILDLGFKTVHPAENVSAAIITALSSFWDRDTPLDVLLTIADEPEFAFVVDLYRVTENSVIEITAYPFITYLRRSILPDWYIPAPECLK